VGAPRAGLVRELVCAALRHSAGAAPADAPAGLHDGWLGDALLRPLLLCAVRRAAALTRSTDLPRSDPRGACHA